MTGLGWLSIVGKQPLLQMYATMVHICKILLDNSAQGAAEDPWGQAFYTPITLLL
jgi:hypothetical protein